MMVSNAWLLIAAAVLMGSSGARAERVEATDSGTSAPARPASHYVKTADDDVLAPLAPGTETVLQPLRNDA
jgi:hypothetical protein